MKRRRSRQFAMLSILAISLAAAVVALRPTERKRVHKQTVRLAARFSKTPGEGPAVMAAKMHTLGDLFADTVVLNLTGFAGNGAYSQAELVSHVSRIRPMFHAIDLSFVDVHVDILGADEASVNLTARLVVSRQDGRTEEDIREVSCRLRKRDGAWRFMAFHEVQVLER